MHIDASTRCANVLLPGLIKLPKGSTGQIGPVPRHQSKTDPDPYPRDATPLTTGARISRLCLTVRNGISGSRRRCGESTIGQGGTAVGTGLTRWRLGRTGCANMAQITACPSSTAPNKVRGRWPPHDDDGVPVRSAIADQHRGLLQIANDIPGFLGSGPRSGWDELILPRERAVGRRFMPCKVKPDIQAEAHDLRSAATYHGQ